MKKTYHLSHIDLDGYGSQFITANTIKNEVIYLNCNYGQIVDTLMTIQDDITKNDELLITDINLTEGEAKMVEAWRKNVGFDLQLLDHHDTGKKVAAQYDWYHLDNLKCGTMLTWEHFGKREDLSMFASIVNAYDLWKENDQYFSKGKALTRIVEDHTYSYPDGFEDEERNMILSLLDHAYILLRNGYSVMKMEQELYNTERHLLLSGKEDNEDLTLHEVRVNTFIDKIMEMEAYTIVNIDGFDTYVFTGLSKIFQTFSNNILHNNERIHVAVNISKRGSMSFRSRRDDINLGAIVKKYFNGGGHYKAAGGKIIFEEGSKPDYPEILEIFEEAVKPFK